MKYRGGEGNITSYPGNDCSDYWQPDKA